MEEKKILEDELSEANRISAERRTKMQEIYRELKLKTEQEEKRQTDIDSLLLRYKKRAETQEVKSNIHSDMGFLKINVGIHNFKNILFILSFSQCNYCQ